MADVHQSGFIRGHSRILQSSKYSDLTLRCGPEEFKIHRAVICTRSEFFDAACGGQFQEAETSTIVLAEDDPSTVGRMVTYLYTLDYDDDGRLASVQHYMANGTEAATSQAQAIPTTPLSEKKLLRHAKMINNVAVYAIAQKYDICELKVLAKAKFHDLLWLKAPTNALHEIIGVVFETTTTTDSGLRNVVVEYCDDHITEVIRDDALCGITRDHGELGLSLLREVHERAFNRCREKEVLHRKLVTLKGHLGRMIEYASSTKSRPRAALASLQQELKTAYDEIDI